MAFDIPSHRIPLLRNSNVLSLAAPLYLFVAFSRFYVKGDTAYYAITLLSALTGFLFLLRCILKQQLNLGILLLIFILVVTNIITMLSSRNNILEVLPQLLSNFGFAWALVYAKLSHRLLYWLSAGILLFFIIHAILRTNPDEIFIISRNYISILVILSIAFYLFSCQQNGTTPSASLLVIAMLVLLWATGRSGILSGGIVLLGTFMISGKRLASAVMLAFVIGISYWTFRPDALAQFDQFTVGLNRFNLLSLESRRSYINDEYFDAVTSSLLNLLFGAPLKNIVSIVDVDGNPHNSFISLHVAFGLVGVVALLWVSSFAMLYLMRTKSSYLSLMLMVALFRSFFDSAAFHGPLDVVVFYCIIFALSSKSGEVKGSVFSDETQLLVKHQTNCNRSLFNATC